MNPGHSVEADEGYLMNELQREFNEEVKLLNACTIEDIKFIGFLNDDNIPVGRHHIGLLYHMRVSNKNIEVNEPDKMMAEWVAKDKLADFYDGMETWSQIVFDFYIRNSFGF